MISGLLTAVLRAALAAILVISAGAKAADVDGFGETVTSLLGIRARRFGHAVGMVAICLELAVGLALATNWAAPTTAAVALLVLTSMAALSAYGWWRRPGLLCRCFGGLTKSTFGRSGLMRGIALGLLAAILFFAESADTVSASPIDAAVWSASSAFVLVAYLGLAFVASQAARSLDKARRSQVH